MQIELLADHEDWIPTLTTWFREEWPDASIEHDPAPRFMRACNRNCIPLTLVAIEDGRVVGTVSLLEQSVASHAHLSPWVAALYVHPEARHRGVATQLIDAAEKRARDLGYAEVYVGVKAGREHYEALDWTFVARGVAGRDAVSVLRMSLRAP